MKGVGVGQHFVGRKGKSTSLPNMEHSTCSGTATILPFNDHQLLASNPIRILDSGILDSVWESSHPDRRNKMSILMSERDAERVRMTANSKRREVCTRPDLGLLCWQLHYQPSEAI